MSQSRVSQESVKSQSRVSQESVMSQSRASQVSQGSAKIALILKLVQLANVRSHL